MDNNLEKIEKRLEKIETALLKIQGTKPLLSIDEMAPRVGRSPKTVRNLLSKGTFPLKPIKVGRRVFFRARDVAAYIEGLGG